MIDKLDQEIYYAASHWHWSHCYDEEDKWEQILDILQDVRESQKGDKLNVAKWLLTVDDLILDARVWRGEFARCGNMLIPTHPPYDDWKQYAAIVMIPDAKKFDWRSLSESKTFD